MGHREALAFAHRVLKAGACLVIADLTLRPTATSDFLAHARDNILADFVPQAGYAELLKEAGFELVELDDVSAHVMPQLVPKISETIAVHQSEIAGLVGEQVMSDTVTSFRFMSENLEYVLITARKA